MLNDNKAFRKAWDKVEVESFSSNSIRDGESKKDYLERILTPKTVDELSNIVPPSLIDGMLRQGEVTTLGANTKTHKTFAAAQAAVCLRNGIPFIGQDVTQMDNVLIIDFELQENTIRRRIKSIQKALQSNFPDTKIVINPGIHVISLRGIMLDFSADLTKQILIEKIRKTEAGAYIIDPMYKTYLGKDENSNTTMAVEVNNWIRISGETATGGLGIDHFSKGEQTGKRHYERIVGAGSKGRSGDNMVTLTECTARKADPLNSPNNVVNGEFYLLEATVRDFEPVCDAIIEWVYPIFRIREDLELMALKTKKEDYGNEGSKRKHKVKYSDDLFFRPLQNVPQGLTGPSWLNAIWKINGEGKPSQPLFYKRVDVYKAKKQITMKGSRYILNGAVR